MKCERTSNWTWTKVGKICKTNLSSYSLLEQWPFVNYLETKGITEGRIIETQHIVLTEKDLPSRARRKVSKDDIVYSTVRPNQRHYGIIKNPLPNMLVSTGFSVLTVDPVQCDAAFLYYWLSQNCIVETLQSLAEQSVSTYPTIRDTDLGALEIFLPPLPEQKRIAAILSSLDDKIELNNKINANLEQQAQALFKAWFVDFEPFGGKMPEDWREYKLSEFLPVVTGKKNANVSSDDGKYPFFSCSQGFSWTDEYSFEGSAILVAGNGDFNVKWYNGKFEAYQRTYVLIPYNARLTGWLYYAIKHNLAEITSAARGSVIKFITKGNLEDFGFYAPVSLAELDIIDTFGWINQMIDHNIQENYRIMRIRDGLLPKLMSGEIGASDISFPKL